MKKLILYFGVLVVVTFLSIAWKEGSHKKNKPASFFGERKAGWKTGVALYSFHKLSFSKALAMLRETEVEYMEGFASFPLGREFNDSTLATLDQEGIIRMKRLLSENGIKMSSMYVKNGAKDANQWKRYFDLAKAFGSSYLVCEPRKEEWDIIDSLAGLYKIKIAIHEHGRSSSIYWHPDSVLAAIKGHKNIGACADLGHWARSGLDPVTCLEKLKGHILGVHVKDITEFGNLKAKDVSPGKGVIDFTKVVKELKRQQFKGYVHIECEYNLENNVKDIKETIKYINELAKKN